MDILNMAVSVLVGAFTVWLTRDAIIPKVAGILSKSAKLHKNWNYKDTKDGDVVGNIKVSQLGKNISAKATRIKERDGKITIREFTYSGTITGRNIVLNFEQNGAGGTVSGSLVLRLNSKLKEMRGSTQYYSDPESKVINHPIFFSASL